MDGAIVGLDLTEALAAGRAFGGTHTLAVTECLAAIETGALKGAAKQHGNK